MEFFMSFFDLVVGKPLATSEERAEHIGPVAGIPSSASTLSARPLMVRRPL